MNLLVAHGGGPTAVINTSLQGVVETARKSGKFEHIYAGRFGIEGIMKKDLIDLNAFTDEEIAKLAHTPASAIGSCRRKLKDEDYPSIIDCVKEYGIDCFFYNGGNDSMDTCNKVNEMAKKEGLDLRVIGIPKTMDNDLMITDHCPGYGSAARYAALNAAELALDAAGLPIHVVVLELMGRNAGWVTAAGAWASRITKTEVLTYLPEIPVDIDKMMADVKAAYEKGKGCLVIVSEGIKDLNGDPIADTGIVDGFGHKIPGGAAQRVSDLIMEKTGIKSRCEKPGLLGRTSILYSSPIDREEAYAVGKYAVEKALEGVSGYMVAIKADRAAKYGYELFLAPLDQVANEEKKFPLEWIVDGNRISDAFFDYAKPLMGDIDVNYAFLRGE